MEANFETELKHLFEVHENNFCFECGSIANEWASINNGIFLCSPCSGIHKGFGIELSFIRSLTQDSWSSTQLEMMKKGGNDKLKEFFERYNLPMDSPMDIKYRTRAAYYYREKLRALAEGLPLPEVPTFEEGIQIVDHSSNFVPIGTETALPKPSPSKLALKKAQTFVGQTVNKTKMATSSLTTPKFKKDVAQGIKTIGNSVVVGAKSVAVGAKNVATKLNEKMKETHFKQDVKVFGNKMAAGAKQTAVVAKKGYIGAVGMLKNLAKKKKTKKQPLEEADKENINAMNVQEDAVQ